MRVVMLCSVKVEGGLCRGLSNVASEMLVGIERRGLLSEAMSGNA